MKNSGIYRIEGPNGWVYIGQSNNVSARWANHRSQLRRRVHANQHLQSAWDKHSESAFRFVILEQAAIGLLSVLEQQHLDAALASGRCYNKAPVADPPRGWTHSDAVRRAARERATGVEASAEARSRMSAAQLRRVISPEEKARIAQKISAAHTGRQVSLETRELMRAARLGKTQSPELVKKRTQGQIGRPMSEKAKAAQKLAAQKRSANPDYRLKLSAAAKRRATDPGFIKTASKNLPNKSRCVACSDGRMFRSMNEASGATGVPSFRISKMCRGIPVQLDEAALRFAYA